MISGCFSLSIFGSNDDFPGRPRLLRSFQLYKTGPPRKSKRRAVLLCGRVPVGPLTVYGPVPSPLVGYNCCCCCCCKLLCYAPLMHKSRNQKAVSLGRRQPPPDRTRFRHGGLLRPDPRRHAVCGHSSFANCLDTRKSSVSSCSFHYRAEEAYDDGRAVASASSTAAPAVNIIHPVVS